MLTDYANVLGTLL